MAMRIRNFGGLHPKDSARALPADGAQVNDNLLAGTTEFRPLAADTTVVAVSGQTDPLTIYRLQRNADGSLNTDFSTAANWKVYAKEVSLVKSQINNDTTDRHYLTTNDGSAAPRMINAAGMDRLLGVPAPTTAPTVTINVTDEFTPEDRNSALDAGQTQVLDIIMAAATPVWRGGTHPGTGTTGFIDRVSTYGFTPEHQGQQVRAYRLTGAGGTVSDAYSTLDDAQFSWIFDPSLPSFTWTAGASPSWAGASVHLAIPFTSYALTYDLNTSAISTGLAAIAMPGTTDGTKLLTAPQVAEIVASLAGVVDLTSPEIKPKLDALSTAVKSLTGLLDGGNYTSLSATVQAFYSKTDVAAEITQIIANAAEAIYNVAYSVAHASLPEDFGGGSSGAGL